MVKSNTVSLAVGPIADRSPWASCMVVHGLGGLRLFMAPEYHLVFLVTAAHCTDPMQHRGGATELAYGHR
jgi:hypothetical protein